MKAGFVLIVPILSDASKDFFTLKHYIHFLTGFKKFWSCSTTRELQYLAFYFSNLFIEEITSFVFLGYECKVYRDVQSGAGQEYFKVF